MEIKWEPVNHDDMQITERMKVDGGYLYRSLIRSVMQPSLTMCLVPDIDLKRYEAHLRDAYRKGYADGQEDHKNGVVNQEEGTTAYGIE